MCTFVPVIELVWDAVFPIMAPGSTPVTAVVTHVMHAAKEDHFECAEEQEQEEDREAESAGEEAEMMAIHPMVAKAISIPKFIAIHHRRNVGRLTIFSGL